MTRDGILLNVLARTRAECAQAGFNFAYVLAYLRQSKWPADRRMAELA